MVYGTQITSYWGESKPTSTGGGAHCTNGEWQKLAFLWFLRRLTKVGSQRVITIYHSYPPAPQQKLTAGLGDSYPEMTELFTGGRSLEDPSVFMLVSEFIREDWEKSNYGKSPCY